MICLSYGRVGTGVILKSIGLKVKEFKIVSSLVPFVLLVVLTRARKFSGCIFVLESTICTELEIWN